MPAFDFCKFHGFGNDYIVIESETLPADTDISGLARAMCERNTGVGSDGIALIERSEKADFLCRIINPDGSEAGFSGNGTRCAVAYLYFRGKWEDEKLRLETLSGVKDYTFLGRSGNSFRFLAELGSPRFASRDIPFLPDSSGTKLEEVIDHPVSAGVRNLKVTLVNVGNPVCAVFVDDFDFNWRRVGRKLESHPQFPERTNVVFVKVGDRERIEIRIWERGAGETSSSGTCSIAAAVVSAHTGKTERRVSVEAPGGTTEAVWREDGEMLIEGTAELAFCGTYEFLYRDEGE
ncbi:MAG: diaminopimelate epimerase [Acidobacteriota bacterium]|nr:MAG: diaminopimelate epimerase [Acidobacteriota bacterium]